MLSNMAVSIYGDSLMKATIPDDKLKYHFRFDEFTAKYASLPISIINRARFGATVNKGLSVLDRDLSSKGMESRYALVEFGGNDCNFNWAEVAAHPEDEHLPNTELSQFENAMETMTEKLSSAGVTPVLMSLPPIDSERYLDYICGDTLDKKNILKWLGDINMIYRFHELYSDSVYKLAVRKKLLFIDVRRTFLEKHNFRNLISADGIHLTEEGYSLAFDTLLAPLAAM